MILLKTKIQEKTITNRLANINNANLLKMILLKKNLMPIKIGIKNIENSKTLILLNVFYKSKRISRYKYKLRFRLRKKKNKKKVLRRRSFKISNILPVFISIKKANNQINFRKLYQNFRGLKRFKKTMFERFFPLFFDFIKMLDLVCRHMAHPENIIVIIGQVFKTLHKKKHGKFKMFMTELLKHVIKRYKLHILGISFMINGRLGKKARASSFKLNYGILESSTFSANKYQTQIHVYNQYGSFGLTMSFNYRSNNFNDVSKKVLLIKAATLKKRKKLKTKKHEFIQNNFIKKKTNRTSNKETKFSKSILKIKNK
jgi:hypothetical protein